MKNSLIFSEFKQSFFFQRFAVRYFPVIAFNEIEISSHVDFMDFKSECEEDSTGSGHPELELIFVLTTCGGNNAHRIFIVRSRLKGA